MDYTESPCGVIFDDVAYFAMSSIDADDRKLWDDRSYTTANSTRIARLAKTGDIRNTTEFTDQIICFNSAGDFPETVHRKMTAVGR